MNIRRPAALWARLFLLLGMLTLLPAQAAAPTEAGTWPREVTNADGTKTTLTAPPRRILSTSVTITGTLLAMDAPVVASATATDGKFFDHWDHVAQEHGVEKLWPTGSVDLEAVYAADPDLIIVSWSGADSARGQLKELQAIAPTLVLDYGGQTWQDLARTIGIATGTENHVQNKLAAFDDYLAGIRTQLNIPAGQANIISFNGPGASNPIALRQGVHAQLLAALGFDIESPDPAWHTNQRPSNDFVWAQYEHLLQLRAPTTFLIRVGDDRASAFLKDPVLANLPSVKTGQVYGLGEDSFRIDYFSARKIAENLLARFGPQKAADKAGSGQPG